MRTSEELAQIKFAAHEACIEAKAQLDRMMERGSTALSWKQQQEQARRAAAHSPKRH